MTAQTDTLTDAERHELETQHHYCMLAGHQIAAARPYLRQLVMDGRAQTNPMPEPNTLPTYAELYANLCILQNALETFKAELGVLLGLPKLEEKYATAEGPF